MNYNRTHWEDKRTPVNAERLNNIENGIEEASNHINLNQESINLLEQGNQLLIGRLNALESDLGYKNIKELQDYNFNDLKTNGKYKLSYENGSIGLANNSPSSLFTIFMVDVIGDGVNCTTQIAYSYSPNSQQGCFYHRTYIDGTWYNWIEVSTKNDIEELNTKIDTINNNISALINRVTTNEGQISAIKGDISDIRNIIGGGDGESLTNRLSKTEGKISVLEGKVATNEESISMLRQEEDTIKGRIDTLESKVTTDTETLKQNLQANINKVASTAQTNLDEAKVELRREITEASSTIQTNLDEVKQTLQDTINNTKDELKSDISGTETRLQSNIEATDQKFTAEVIDIKEALIQLSERQVELNEDLQAHKEDEQAHIDIREKMGDNDNLLTKSRTLVEAINELFLLDRSTMKKGIIRGTEKVVRLTANEDTDTFVVDFAINPNTTSVYLMGLRLFLGKDFSIDRDTLTLNFTVKTGEYIDIFTGEEIIVDMNTGFIEEHHRFVAETETNVVNIVNITTARYTLEVYQEGVRLYEDYDYILNKNIGTITLSQPLEVGEYIDYTLKINTGQNVTEIYSTLDAFVEQKENIKMLPQLISNLETKVDKIEGKSLVDNAEIERLARVNNYDDTQIKEDIKGLIDKTTPKEEPRNTDTLPSDYVYGMTLRGLKDTQSIGMGGNGLAHIFGYNSWVDNTAYVHELALSNGEMFIRKNQFQNEDHDNYNSWDSWKQIATLDKVDKCPVITFEDGSLLNYIKTLPLGSHTCFQFANAEDAPTMEWYYAEVFIHIYTNAYFYVRLYNLSGKGDSYELYCYGGEPNFNYGWKKIDGRIVTRLGTNIFVDMDDTNLCHVDRETVINGFNSTNSPTGNTDNDFFYRVIKTSGNTTFRVVAYDNRSNDIYTTAKINNQWQGWEKVATQSQINDINRDYFHSYSDFHGSANDLIKNGVCRDIGGVTDLPSTFGNIITFNSSVGSGNYLTQLYCNREGLWYRWGGDNNLPNDWSKMATTENSTIDTANGFYSAWTTNYSDVLQVEEIGDVVHVRGLIGITNSVVDTKINASPLPPTARDRWIMCSCLHSPNTFNIYFGWDRNLYCQTNGFSGEFQVDFTYRKG